MDNKRNISREVEYTPFELHKLDLRCSGGVVLVTCGSFNPITWAHLRMIEVAREEVQRRLAADSSRAYHYIGGILSPVSSAYEKPGLASVEHRLAMCRLACESSSNLQVYDWEAVQKAYTRTLCVLEHVEREITRLCKHDDPSATPQVTVVLVCGADLLASFNAPGVWHDDDIEAIASRFKIACLDREGSFAQEAISNSKILLRYEENMITFRDEFVNTTSSTKVRKAIAQHRSIKYIVPDSVIEYIAARRLYST